MTSLTSHSPSLYWCFLSSCCEEMEFHGPRYRCGHEFTPETCTWRSGGVISIILICCLKKMQAYLGINHMFWIVHFIPWNLSLVEDCVFIRLQGKTSSPQHHHPLQIISSCRQRVEIKWLCASTSIGLNDDAVWGNICWNWEVAYSLIEIY